MRVAIFNSLDVPLKIMEGAQRHFDGNTPAGGYWREIPDYVQHTQDVPLPITLPIWPDRLAHLNNPSAPVFGDSVLVSSLGSITFAAATGLSIKTEDDVVHAESGGNITVVFPEEGYQRVSVQESGKDPLSSHLEVIFLSGYAQKLKDTVDSVRDARLLADITVSSVTLDGDTAAQRNITEAATMGAFETIRGNTGWTINWITASNTSVTFTAAEIEAFAQAIGVRRETEYALARAAKNNIDAAIDKATADAALLAYTSP